MFIFKLFALLSLALGVDAYGGYSLVQGNQPNFKVSNNIKPNQLVSGWSYVSLDEISNLDFPQFGNDAQKMVPAGKRGKAKVMAYKMAARLPLVPAIVTRDLVTSKAFLTRVNGIEFIPGKDKLTIFGKKFQGYVSLPFNRSLLDLDVTYVDLNTDTNLVGYQELVDRFDQGDDQLGAPAKIIVTKAIDINGGYLHGMYNIFKLYPWGNSEVLLVSYTLSIVDAGNFLIKLVGGGKLKSSLDETSLNFIDELAKTK